MLIHKVAQANVLLLSVTIQPAYYVTLIQNSYRLSRRRSNFPNIHSGCFCCLCLCLSPQKPSSGVALLCGNFSVTSVLRVSQYLPCRRFASSLAVHGGRTVTPFGSILTPLGHSVNKFPTLVGNPGFFATFTGVRRWSLTLAIWIQFTCLALSLA